LFVKQFFEVKFEASPSSEAAPKFELHPNFVQGQRLNQIKPLGQGWVLQYAVYQQIQQTKGLFCLHYDALTLPFNVSLEFTKYAVTSLKLRSDCSMSQHSFNIHVSLYTY
jgi:hypothetical protein